MIPPKGSYRTSYHVGIVGGTAPSSRCMALWMPCSPTGQWKPSSPLSGEKHHMDEIMLLIALNTYFVRIYSTVSFTFLSGEISSARTHWVVIIMKTLKNAKTSTTIGFSKCTALTSIENVANINTADTIFIYILNCGKLIHCFLHSHTRSGENK